MLDRSGTAGGGAMVEEAAEATTAATTRRQSPGMLALRIAVSLVLVAAIFYFLLRDISLADVGAAITDMTWGELTTLAVAAGWNLVTYAFVWMTVTPGLGFGRAMVMTQPTTAITNTAPAGSAIGVGMTYAMLSSWGLSRGRTTIAVLVSGVWNTFAKLGIPVLALALVALQGDASAGRVTAALLEHGWIPITAATLVSHLSLYLVLLLALRAVGVSDAEVGWAEVLAVFAFARLATAIPITPGGAGVVEAVLITGLTAAGGDKAQVVAAVLVYRALTWGLPIVVGIGCLLWWRRQSLTAPAPDAAGATQAGRPARAGGGRGRAGAVRPPGPRRPGGGGGDRRLPAGQRPAEPALPGGVGAHAARQPAGRAGGGAGRAPPPALPAGAGAPPPP